MNNLIIGIAGGSGSGKTTLALRLKERFGEDEVRLISHDSYYKRHDDLPFEERCKLNYDHPDAFDNALLIYHLQELKAGRAIDCPVYDYSNHNRSDKVQHIEPAPVLIVEGILPFVEPERCRPRRGCRDWPSHSPRTLQRCHRERRREPGTDRGPARCRLGG